MFKLYLNMFKNENYFMPDNCGYINNMYIKWRQGHDDFDCLFGLYVNGWYEIKFVGRMSIENV